MHNVLKRALFWRETYRKRGAARLPFWVWLNWTVHGHYRLRDAVMRP